MTQRDKVGAIVLAALLAAMIATFWFTSRKYQGEPRPFEENVLVDQITRTQQFNRDKK